MYSKAEVCFTIIVALAASWHLNSQQATDPAGSQGDVLTVFDGGHPPPSSSADALQADGTHPPPPPWPMIAMQVS
jgi:hypothetical protein